jgi:hypothetical protein
MLRLFVNCMSFVQLSASSNNMIVEPLQLFYYVAVEFARTND